MKLTDGGSLGFKGSRLFFQLNFVPLWTALRFAVNQSKPAPALHHNEYPRITETVL